MERSVAFGSLIFYVLADVDDFGIMYDEHLVNPCDHN